MLLAVDMLVLPLGAIEAVQKNYSFFKKPLIPRDTAL